MQVEQTVTGFEHIQPHTPLVHIQRYSGLPQAVEIICGSFV